MKNLRKPLMILTLIVISVYCYSQNIDLFDAISVQLPVTLTKDNTRENCFVNSENGVSLIFDMTKDKSYGELLPKIDFDFLYNPTSRDSTFKIKHKEIREISGLKVGIVEKSMDDTEIKTFFTEVNNEILTGELRGDVKNGDYMCSAFEGILNSIKKK